MSKAVTVANVKKPALQIGTGALGAMFSKAVAPYVPGGAAGKIALALGMGVLAVVASKSKGLQAAAIGAGTIQFVEGASELAAPTVASLTEGKEGALYDGLRKTVGLASPRTSYYENILRTGMPTDLPILTADAEKFTPSYMDAAGA